MRLQAWSQAFAHSLHGLWLDRQHDHVDAVDGFGIVGGNIHTPEEYAEVASVAPRIYLLSRMIMELAKPR